MKYTVGTSIALACAATSALASPIIKLASRQQQPQDVDDAILYSPANMTEVNAGSTFNFTYQCDDDSTTTVRVALIQYIELAADITTTTTSGGNKMAMAQITVPANLTAGSYVIGVDEISNDTNDTDNNDDNDDNDDDDGNDDDGDGDDNDNSNDSNDDNDDSYDPYDYDIKFKSPDNLNGNERPFVVSVGAATA